MQRPRQQHPILEQFCGSDRIDQGTDAFRPAVTHFGEGRAALDQGLGAHPRGADRIGLDDRSFGPLDGIRGSVVEHVDLGNRGHRCRPLLARWKGVDELLHLLDELPHATGIAALVGDTCGQSY